VSSPPRGSGASLPEPLLGAIRALEDRFGAEVRITGRGTADAPADLILYASPGLDGRHVEGVHVRDIVAWRGQRYRLEVVAGERSTAEGVVEVLEPMLAYTARTAQELGEFAVELAGRFEEINLLYSISETLGTTLDLVSAAHKILEEVREVMGAERGSIWVYRGRTERLHLAAEAGGDGQCELAESDEPDAITVLAFKGGRAVIATREPTPEERAAGHAGHSILSVPIRYSPGRGESRTVGVINLVGRRDGERFNASNQRLLSAIASQVGAAIENNRLVHKTLSRERMAREMELAHDLQMKLLPDLSAFRAGQAAGRVQPTEQVGGDFYQLFQLNSGRIGVMLGDVSLHGFPSALIMTLAMSAAGIYAREHDAPADVLRGLDDALRDELETTEMFLTLFYGVIDPAAGTLVYANAGHPHAFLIRGEGGSERLEATDPPVGFAGPDAYHQACRTWQVRDDLLLLFTDGLSDALTSTTRGNGERIVVDTAERLRRSSPEKIIDALFELTVNREGGAAAGDDRTALVVRCCR